MLSGLPLICKMKTSDKHKKIALLVMNFIPYDGIGQLTKQRAEELTKQGHDVTVICMHADKKWCKELGVEVESIR